MSAEAKASLMLRTWVKERIDGVDAIDLDGLTDEAMKRYANDSSFVQSLVRERFRYWLSEAIREQVSRTRMVPMGEGSYLSKEAFADRVASSKFSTWLERTSEGHYVRLVAMDRDAALSAASLRMGQAEKHLHVARFLEQLAAPLKNGEVIGDHWDEQRMYEVWQAITGTKEVPEEVAS